MLTLTNLTVGIYQSLKLILFNGLTINVLTINVCIVIIQLMKKNTHHIDNEMGTKNELWHCPYVYYHHIIIEFVL